jgi:hypothetical protein
MAGSYVDWSIIIGFGLAAVIFFKLGMIGLARIAGVISVIVLFVIIFRSFGYRV